MYRILFCSLMSVLLFSACSSKTEVSTKVYAESGTSLSEEENLSTESKTHSEMLQMLYSMEEAYSSVEDYSTVLLRQERIENELMPEQTIKLYFKKPFSIYMKWIKGPNKGVKAVFRKGHNEDKVLVRAGIFGLYRTFRMDPLNERLMKDNRHPITEAGIGSFIDMLLKIVRGAEENSELKLAYRGEYNISDRAVHKIESILPEDKEKGYYCYRAVIGIDKQSGLPIMVEIYLWDNLLYECYIYSELELNIGVKESIFESLN